MSRFAVIELSDYTPEEKRAIYVSNISHESDNWKYDDRKINYGIETVKSIAKGIESAVTYGTAGAAVGAKIAGPIGAVVGGFIGGAYGFVKGFINW